MNLTYFQPRKRRIVENNNSPLNIRFVAKISEMYLKTSDLMLKHQKWQHCSRLENVSVVNEISCVTKGLPAVKRVR